MLTNRQKQTIERIKKEYKDAARVNGFDYQPHKIFFDKKNDWVVLVTYYERTLCNILDDGIAMSIIDIRGRVKPLSHVIKFAKARLDYLVSLEEIVNK
jgi:hypothetical protein